MKSLRESILADMNDVLKAGDKTIKNNIKQWLKENLAKGISKCKISRTPNKDGKYEVSSKDNVVFNKKVISLTNGMFIWTEVDGSFNCSNCPNLTSLKGAPEIVNGSFLCSKCKSLKTLEGVSKEVGKKFDCTYCYDLTSLALPGTFEKVGDFVCNNCYNLKSLKGAPEKVDGHFLCNSCSNLTSLEGCPKIVGGVFDCSCCSNLTSLKGAPKEVDGNFGCYNCGKPFIKDEVKSLCDVKGEIYT